MVLIRGAGAWVCAVLVSITLLLAGAVMQPAAADFTPGSGITFNNAYGSRAQQNAILTKILKSIRAVPRGGEIEIMSWNFNSRPAVKALLRAQERNVRIRFLQSRGNVAPDGEDSFGRLKKGFERGNRGLDRSDRSWIRACRQSCRGRGGAAHAKYFLFSQVGRAENVVIQGSANLTSTSAFNQWNDIQTFTNRRGPYAFMSKVFEQMSHDRPVRRTFVQWRGGPDRLAFFPGGSAGKPDPVMQVLNQVRCSGAANTASGRTRIRVAPDVIREARGMRLARKLRALWVNGCDVRVGYTVVGLDVGRMLRQPSRRGPVPLAHMVRDRNQDGQFDDYFHMKAIAVTGHVAGDRRGYVTLNGSQNWSDASARSDENIAVSYRKGMTRKYSAHIDRWYRFFKARGANRYAFARDAGAEGRLVDGLLLGAGDVDGVDPYANLEED